MNWIYQKLQEDLKQSKYNLKKQGLYVGRIKKDIEDLMRRMDAGEPEMQIDVEIGANVKIVDGPFKGFEGKVSEIDQTRGKIKVMVNMFGRDTSVELDSLQIKKVN